MKKINEGTHSNIHQRSNITTMESIIDKEDDADRRKNTIRNVKLNEDVTTWKERENRNYKPKKKYKIKHQKNNDQI